MAKTFTYKFGGITFLERSSTRVVK